MKILAVDDDASNLKLLRFILEGEGHQVGEAGDGEAALALLAGGDFDVIISDILMPRMDGYRLCDAVRQDERWRDVAFIFYTATYTSAGDEKLCLEIGADKFLMKPATTEELVAALQAVMGSGTRRASRHHARLDDAGVMKEYNQRLVSKLEEKNHEMERANADLRAGEERFHGTLDNMLEGAQLIGFDWRYMYVNETAARHGQRTREELIGRTLTEVYPDFENTEIFKVMQHCMTVRAGVRVENRFLYTKESAAWFELSIQPVPEGIFILSLDITERKLASQQLKESEERFRQLAENINEVFWISDPSNKAIYYVSPAYESIWGKTCQSVYENPVSWLDAIHPKDRARVIESGKSRLVLGTYEEVYRILRPDGTQRWILDRAFPVRNENGEVYRIVGTAEDITARKRAELRTEVQHAVTAVLSEAVTLMETAHRILEIVCRQLDWDLGDLWTIDRTSRMLRCVEIWNPSSTEFQPFAEASRQVQFAIGEGLPGSVWKEKKAEWVSDVTQDPRFRRRREAAAIGLRDALVFPIKLRNEVFGVVEFFSTQSRPIDGEMLSLFAALGTQIGQFIERKQLEDQFRQAQKMEAIGTLAGGIAHDFNNVLAAIKGYTDLARMQSGNNPEVLGYLDAVSEGSRRAADLVRQILAFSRLQEQQRKLIQLWPILEEALRLLRATMPTTIQFDTSLLRRGPMVLADPTQIHQLVMNLATNAAHAMKDRPGRLGITLESIEADGDLVALNPGLRIGSYMLLSVSDTGHGMDEGTLNRIFDPFFTTKKAGEGTGLGLAVVHGIVQNHEGVITVTSQLGQGTRFQVYLPAQAGEIEEAVAAPIETPRGEGQQILFVDDEPTLALMGRIALERLGYKVESHTVPAEALAAVRSGAKHYDLVITDLTMPGMNGTDLAEQMLRLRPDLLIVLTTGYSATLTREKVRALGIHEMLLKPVTIQGLGELVHRVLKERASKQP